MSNPASIYVVLQVDVHQNPVTKAVNSFSNQEAAIKCMAQLEAQNQDFEHQYFQIQKVDFEQTNNRPAENIDFLSQWIKASHALERSYQMLQSDRKNKSIKRIKHRDFEDIKHYLNHNRALMDAIADEIKSKK